jgi:hypothetical protein
MENQEAATHTNGEPCNIQKRIPFSFEYVPKGYPKVIEKHGGCFNETFARKIAGKGTMVMPSYKYLTGRSSGAYSWFHCTEMNSFCPLISTGSQVRMS